MPQVARADLAGKTSRTVSVALFTDGDLGFSQGRDMALLDSEQQGQFFAWARKHLPHFFQTNARTQMLERIAERVRETAHQGKPNDFRALLHQLDQTKET